MPIITTLVIGRSPRALAGSECHANQSWAMISAALRLRLKPCRAVAQKVQSRAQPTCEETHSVARSPSGMYTVSMALPSSRRITHLRVPSLLSCCITSSGARTSASSISRVRRALLMSVIWAKSVTPR